MTYSIVARSTDGFTCGVAVASKFLAVGAVVPAAEAGVGALATQSYANCAYRPQGLALMRSGVDPTHTIAGLIGADQEPAQRQVGVVGPCGDGATFTGEQCNPWAGGMAGDGYAIQGNILTGPQVVDAMREGWLGSVEEPRLARRLLAALLAGERAGGDRRGRQSAALLVVGKAMGYAGTSDVMVELRVDDHPDPVPELARLLELHTLYFDRPRLDELMPLTGTLGDEVRKRLAALGHTENDLDGALAGWAGVANLEERLSPGAIDPLVLAHLRDQG